MTLARWTWLAVAAQLLVVEIVALLTGRELLTNALRAGLDRYLLWPAIFGALCGHFFGEKGGPTWGPSILIAAALGVLWHDLVVRDTIAPHSHFELFVLFAGAGAWLWGSR